MCVSVCVLVLVCLVRESERVREEGTRMMEGSATQFQLHKTHTLSVHITLNRTQ